MSRQAEKPDEPRGKKPLLPTWFQVSAAVVVAVIVLEALQVRIFVEVSFDGVPYFASLTDIRTWFVPLGLLLVYILGSWAWNRYFGSGNR